MTFTTNVGGNFKTVGQANPANLPQSRVRLFRSGRVNAGANTTSLRTRLQGWYVTLDDLTCAGLAHQLADSSHKMITPPLIT
jgi:hypothetical protein